MAYSPIDQGALSRNADLRALASRRAITPAQLALAWLSAQAGVMAIPKSADLGRLKENLDSRAVELSRDDLAALDRAFPAANRKTPLTMR